MKKNGLKELKEKDLYHITYNVEEEEKYIIEEKKYYLPPETIKRKFYIFMASTVYIFREGQPDPDEVEEEYHIKKIDKIHRMCNMFTKSPECIIY